MTSRSRLCVVTGTRAEYGLLKWLMREVQASRHLELSTVVGGMHLSAEFGHTWKEIEADGFRIDDRLDYLLGSDTSTGVTKSLGLAVIGFADVFARQKPDAVVLLGDRFEALAAAQSALLANIPLVHIHGGEATEGAVDESIRHAITKMSQLHFVATAEYRRRVIQLGENPEHVSVTGALGIDGILKSKLMSQDELEANLGFSLGKAYFLVTYHPETLAGEGAAWNMDNLFRALDHFPDRQVLVTYPNADQGGRELIAQLEAYAARQPERVHVVKSLGAHRYWSALSHCGLVVGNSSSGIIEAPSFSKCTINIGDRQRGRVRAASVIDCVMDANAISEAIVRAGESDFAAELEQVRNPYGQGDAASRMLAILERTEFGALRQKPFFDLDFAVPPEEEAE